MKVLSAEQMRQLDEAAIGRLSIPSIVLMENASRAAAAWFAGEFPYPRFANVVVVAGKGNNGGDGLAIGRLLWQRGYRVTCFLLSTPDRLNPDPRINFEILKSLDIPCKVLESADELSGHLLEQRPGDTFIVDAIFGTGLDRPVGEGLFAAVIRAVNESNIPVAAVDIPSGLSASFLPEEGEQISARVTATFQCLKLAHIHPDGNRFCGKIGVFDIGIPRTLIDDPRHDTCLISPKEAARLLNSTRDPDGHKGDFGHCLNISGSLEKPGAGILSSYAILRAGAGLCTVAVSPDNRGFAVQAHPEVMEMIYRKARDIVERLDRFDVVLLGPGLGNTDETFDTVTKIIQTARTPVVLDADAVNVFQRGKEFFKSPREIPIVITPHPGEFSRLAGVPVAEVRRNRIGWSRQFAVDFNLYVVLKGHHTVVATPRGRVVINQSGNPGMATAGSGDVLAGILTGLIGQFYPAWDLESILGAGVFIHGFAGDLAAAELGEMAITASDLLRYLPRAVRECDGYRTRFPFFP